MSDTPRTDEALYESLNMLSTETLTKVAPAIKVLETLMLSMERALSRFERTELPEEPSGVQFVRNDVRGYGREAINYIDALRAHAARMIVERDEAKERADELLRAVDSWQVQYLSESNMRKLQTAALADAERRAEESARQLSAAKYIVWCAQWAFHKLLRQGRIMPHAECEHFAEMLPKVEKWLEINGQVGVNFKEGQADIEAALAAQEEAPPIRHIPV